MRKRAIACALRAPAAAAGVSEAESIKLKAEDFPFVIYQLSFVIDRSATHNDK